MMSASVKLNSREMATFAAAGLLRLDGIIPESINQQFLAEAGPFEKPKGTEGSHQSAYTLTNFMARSQLPTVTPGTVLDTAY